MAPKNAGVLAEEEPNGDFNRDIVRHESGYVIFLAQIVIQDEKSKLNESLRELVEHP